ncbi:amidohydrolase [Fodinisporobacter ferrooxydans]|uniref:Amidohydrolase n=1 Tax=Fodinisporobacter ferrooxydans TaxID=2901836 RepID=A0ABY4CEI2_9BACL|nr:amidohydrolase [Alicyclobacillaceae bacterium MYW30-H2]
MYDVHTHFIPADVLDWLKENKTIVNAKWEKRDPDKDEFLVVNGKWAFELKQTFVDSVLYLDEQAKAGIAHSLISPIPQLFGYDFEASITQEISTVYNESLAKWVNSHRRQISALGTVPLNHPVQAAMELQHAMDLGLKGAIIGPGLSENMLTDEYFTPFWEEADKQNAIIFIHPLLCDDPRLKKQMMPNLIGVPWETTVCATDLLLSGFLDRYPNVKIVLAHGGGFLPYQIGRLDKGYDCWKMIAASLEAPPAEYLKRFWYDSVLWNTDSLNYLIETVGADRVVPGSDFPFDLCSWPPVATSEKGVQSLLFK